MKKTHFASQCICAALVILAGCSAPATRQWQRTGAVLENRVKLDQRSRNRTAYDILVERVLIDADRVSIPVTAVSERSVEELWQTESRQRFIEVKSQERGRLQNAWFGNLLWCTIAGELAGAGLGYVVASRDSLGDKNTATEVAFMLLGVGAGAVWYALTHPYPRADRTQPTGREENRSLGTTSEWRPAPGGKSVQPVAAADVPILLSSSNLLLSVHGEQPSSTLRCATDAEGTARFRVAGGPPRWAPGRDGIWEIINALDISRYVKPPSKDLYLQLFADEVYDKAYTMNIETNARSKATDSIVENDRAEITIPGREFAADAELLVLKAIVNHAVNRHIHTATIQIKNIDSKTKISMANLEGQMNGPDAEQLLSAHLRAPLLERAMEFVSPYESGRVESNVGDDGVVMMDVLLPCDLVVEITHPKYFAVTQSIHFDEEHLSKTVLMSELGTKMRVRVVDY